MLLVFPLLNMIDNWSPVEKTLKATFFATPRAIWQCFFLPAEILAVPSGLPQGGDPV